MAASPEDGKVQGEHQHAQDQKHMCWTCHACLGKLDVTSINVFLHIECFVSSPEHVHCKTNETLTTKILPAKSINKLSHTPYMAVHLND